MNLQEEVKARYGKNYTQCTNEQLNEVVTSVYKSTPCEANAFQKLVDVLVKKRILLKSEVDEIMKG